MGGMLYSVGVGLSIFDILKIQGSYGQAAYNSISNLAIPSLAGGHSGMVVSGKVLANLFYFNFNSWLKTGMAAGFQYAFFFIEEADPVRIPQVFGQWELLRADFSHFFPKWKSFKSFSLYVEPGVWFAPKAINGSNDKRTEFTIGFGGRISLF
jgi:hypothetical protein